MLFRVLKLLGLSLLFIVVQIPAAIESTLLGIWRGPLSRATRVLAGISLFSAALAGSFEVWVAPVARHVYLDAGSLPPFTTMVLEDHLVGAAGAAGFALVVIGLNAKRAWMVQVGAFLIPLAIAAGMWALELG